MKRLALVLGSNGPEKLGSLKRLAFAKSDAVRFANEIAAADSGFWVPELKERQSRARLLEELDDFVHQLQPGDALLFYFAGHGLRYRGELYLILDETLDDRLNRTALPWLDVQRIIKGAHATDKAVILDCCHAGMAFNDPLTVRGNCVSETSLDNSLMGSFLAACRAGLLKTAQGVFGMSDTPSRFEEFRPPIAFPGPQKFCRRHMSARILCIDEDAER